MPYALDQILPSLQSLGILAYWLIGLASALEAFFVTGVIIPGTLVVDAGGVIVQRGLLDFFDLAWFVAIGSVLGSEASYWTGRLAMHRIPGRRRIEGAATFVRAKRLFEKRGGAALVFGRFLGPVAGLVPLAAAMAGMERRRFVIWNCLGSIPYALVHVGIGYFLGDVMGRIGGSMTRVAVLVGVVLLLLIVLWALLYSALRLLPLVLAVLSSALRGVADVPAIARRIESYPRTVLWVEARFDRSTFTGLPLTLLGIVFLYIAGVWLDTVVDFLSGTPMLQFDMRLAELTYHFQSAGPIRVASLVTAVGGAQVVVPLLLASMLWLFLEGRRLLAAGLLVSVLGNTVSVALLKMLFQRPRSPLGYFAETSGSFPSGHAAVSIAFYGMLMYVLWRAGRLRAETALLVAGLAAFAIGVSRIYLIEHYLSDVLNGWLVGALWVVIGIAVAEWLASRPGATGTSGRLRGRMRVAGLTVVVALVGVAGLGIWRLDHPRNPAPRTADIVLTDPQDLARAADFPAVTESLLGSPLRPISVIVLAADEAALGDAMIAAGWAASTPPTPGLIVNALFSAIKADADPSVRTVSHFWRGQPNDRAFVQGATGQSGPSTPPVKARFWRTEYVTPQGARAFAGAIGVDYAEGSAAPVPASGAQTGGQGAVQGLRAQGARVVANIVLPASDASKDVATASAAEVTVLALP